jgi:UDP-N-acetylglucosamine acyltransferase
VGPFAIIDAEVVIGAGTTVGPHAVINGPTRIGARNRIFQFASIGSDPQDKKYRGERSYLEIGDQNVFREFCTVNRGTANDQGVTRIGSHNLFMAYTHVAHDCVLGDHIVMANCATLAGHVHLGDWVHMGGLSAAHQFSKVGVHAFIANNTAVTRDVPPYVMAVGQPAEPHSINAEGMRRRGFTAEQIRNVRNAFRILYQSDLKLVGRGRALCRRSLLRSPKCAYSSTLSGPRRAASSDERGGGRARRRRSAAHRLRGGGVFRGSAGSGINRCIAHARAGIECFGVAGPRMIAAGCEAWASAEELAVMGLAEVLRHLPRCCACGACSSRALSLRRDRGFRRHRFPGVQSGAGRAPEGARPVHRAVRQPAGVGLAAGTRAHDRPRL